MVLAVGLLSGPGCGLSDYERKMEEVQQAQRQFEEETKLLAGTTLKLPEKQTGNVAGEAPLTTLFGFRPPRGIATTPAQSPLGPLGVYHGSTDSGFNDVLAGAVKARGRESFQQQVLQRLGVEGVANKLEVKRPNGQTLPFDYYQQDGPTQSTRVYFTELGDYVVAIAFRIPADTAWSTVEPKIKASLATLEA